MITLYDNPFSPFARKVRMVLRIKEIPFRSVDALARSEHQQLERVNDRAEVPVLIEDGVIVVDSADIVAYLEDRHPEPSILPDSAGARAKARHWQRRADTVLDAIIHDISIWIWPTHRRPDQPPPGLLEAGRRDLERILTELEQEIDRSGFCCDTLSIADLALFPHVSSLKPLGIVLDDSRHPNLCRWNRQMRSQAAVAEDLAYLKQSAVEKFASGPSPYEDERIVWRGDRIEWLLASGFADWFVAELRAGRAVIPRSV
jgi:glutathione S-transferase